MLPVLICSQCEKISGLDLNECWGCGNEFGLADYIRALRTYYGAEQFKNAVEQEQEVEWPEPPDIPSESPVRRFRPED